MLTLDSNLFFRIVQLPDGPTPLPLRSGFSEDVAYRAVGMFNPSETSDAYLILVNDRDEIWFICNRHLRAVAACEQREFRVPLADFETMRNPKASAAVIGRIRDSTVPALMRNAYERPLHSS